MKRSIIVTLVFLAACGGSRAPDVAAAPEPVPDSAAAVPAAPPAAPVRNQAQDREIARLRSQLAERDASIADLQRRLDEAIAEVVRNMARLRTLATRAEAASAMAEAEVVVGQMRTRSPRSAELRQAETFLRNGSAELDAGNYAGAVYLASQAKRVAMGRSSSPR